MEEVIRILLEMGFTEDGATPVAAHGVQTASDPGKIALVGGRLRFVNGKQYATVGKRTTCLYIKEDGQITESDNFNTKSIEEIKAHLTKKQGESH